jgi:hypothetical protein
MTSEGFGRPWFSLSVLGFLALTAVACGSSGNSPGDGGGGSSGSVGTGGRGGGSGGGSGGATSDAATCTTPQYTSTSAFGAIFDGWVIASNSTYVLVPMPGEDGGPPTGSKLELDTADGSPMNGSAKLTIPFTEPIQEVIFAKNFAPGVNLSGTTVTAKIKLDSGLIVGPTDVGTAFLVLKVGETYAWAPGTSITLDPTAGWVSLTLSADAPNPQLPFGYSPCDVREIDIIIKTGDTGMYREAVVHIDTIAITAN